MTDSEKKADKSRVDIQNIKVEGRTIITNTGRFTFPYNSAFTDEDISIVVHCIKYVCGTQAPTESHMSCCMSAVMTLKLAKENSTMSTFETAAGISILGALSAYAIARDKGLSTACVQCEKKGIKTVIKYHAPTDINTDKHSVREDAYCDGCFKGTFVCMYHRHYLDIKESYENLEKNKCYACTSAVAR